MWGQEYGQISVRAGLANSPATSLSSERLLETVLRPPLRVSSAEDNVRLCSQLAYMMAPGPHLIAAPNLPVLLLLGAGWKACVDPNKAPFTVLCITSSLH